MTLYLTHGNGEESIPLELPASSSQVEEIDIRLDDICSGEGNFRISDVKSSVKGLWQFIRSADLLAPEDLEKLNRLSRQIDAMSEKEHQIFAGALLSECISNLDDVLQTVGRIGQYGMIPKVTCDRELGGYLVEHGKIDCPEHLKPYLDYVGIGAEFYSNCGGAYTLDGYVVRKEHLSNHSQVPEPWRNENRDEMLRMTLRVDGKPDYILVLPADEEYLDAVKAYRRVVWTQHGEKRTVWRCCSRLDYGKKYCEHSPTLDEAPLQQAILNAVNASMSDHGTLSARLMSAMEQELAPIPGESMSLGDIDRAMEELGKQFDKLLGEAANADDAETYVERFQSLSEGMEDLKRRKAGILQIRQEQDAVSRRLQASAAALDAVSAQITEWDEKTVYQLLEKVTVMEGFKIRVTFRNGQEIEQSIDQPKRRKRI